MTRKKKAIRELTEAIRLTQEYARLPARPGWSWFDALAKYAPAKLDELLKQERQITINETNVGQVESPQEQSPTGQ